MKSDQLNDLFDYEYSIYQNDDYFKFSIDSVLLAEFVSVKKNQKELLDLCSGNCPVPMILHKKFGDLLNYTAIELQKEIYELGVKSLEYNNIKDINYIKGDLLDYKNYFFNKKYDIITCNPPYFVNYNDNYNKNDIKAIARHELTMKLEDIFLVSSKLLENQGSLFLVHRPERLADIIICSKKYNFGVKKLQNIHNDSNSQCCFILVELVYNAKDYVKINKPIFLDDYISYKNIFEEVKK